MEGGGFEPPKRCATDLQSAPFGHSGNLPRKYSFNSLRIADAVARTTRIADFRKLRLLSQLLRNIKKYLCFTLSK